MQKVNNKYIKFKNNQEKSRLKRLNYMIKSRKLEHKIE
jgi:hypothetical protein